MASQANGQLRGEKLSSSLPGRSQGIIPFKIELELINKGFSILHMYYIYIYI